MNEKRAIIRPLTVEVLPPMPGAKPSESPSSQSSHQALPPSPAVEELTGFFRPETPPSRPEPAPVESKPSPSDSPRPSSIPASPRPNPLASIPGLSAGVRKPSAAPSAANRAGKPRKKSFRSVWAVGVVAGAAIVGAIGLSRSGGGPTINLADLLLHTVRVQDLDLTVMDKGTLESAENREVICRVKASKGGSFATTIKWVIDDGTLVRAGQPIVSLDSSALEDQYLAQKIVLEQARAAKISAEENCKIVESQNESDEETAKNAIQLAELDLEKYVGLPRGTVVSMPHDESRKLLLEMEKDVQAFLVKYAVRFPSAKGEFQQTLDDVTGRIDLAVAELEQWKDRAAYSRRMQLKGYLSPSQVQSDESRLASANESLKKVEMERILLRAFTAQRMIKDYSGKVQEAWRALDRTRKQAHAKEITSIADRDTKTSIARQEDEKLEEIEKQIHECKIMAPQSGLVVYYVSEQSRSGSGSSQSIIAQGEPVREGQKLMRIPDLTRMQVSTRVHEAMISRIRGDDRRSTGFGEALRVAMLVNPDSTTRLLQTQDEVLDVCRTHFRDKEYYLAGAGQRATIRLDAFPDRRLKGHVRMIASVASQQDWMSADVKLYQTIVSIDEPLDGLKPGMSAEVVIEVDATRQSVLAVPIQAIVGGTESGASRKVYVMTESGPQEREIVVGLANEKMAEVVSGLEEGDRVIENPKLIVGEKAKTREPGELRTPGGKSDKSKGKDSKGKDGK